MEPYILIVLLVSFVALVAGLTSKQTKEFSDYLRSQNAITEESAIAITEDVKRKYRLAIPILSGMKLKVTKDKKYWVS